MEEGEPPEVIKVDGLELSLWEKQQVGLTHVHIFRVTSVCLCV
jgi:hypothetical protein